MPHIFKPFVELRNNKLEQGSGIGLSVARSLAVSMNGSLTCTSVEGSGPEFELHFHVFGASRKSSPSVFRGVLGRDNTGESMDDASESGVSPNTSLTLVLDDNIVNVKMLGKIAERYASRCDTTMSGLSAIEMCNESKYDGIFMDMVMSV